MMGPASLFNNATMGNGQSQFSQVHGIQPVDLSEENEESSRPSTLNGLNGPVGQTQSTGLDGAGPEERRLSEAADSRRGTVKNPNTDEENNSNCGVLNGIDDPLFRSSDVNISKHAGENGRPQEPIRRESDKSSVSLFVGHGEASQTTSQQRNGAGSSVTTPDEGNSMGPPAKKQRVKKPFSMFGVDIMSDEEGKDSTLSPRPRSSPMSSSKPSPIPSSRPRFQMPPDIVIEDDEDSIHRSIELASSPSLPRPAPPAFQPSRPSNRPTTNSFGTPNSASSPRKRNHASTFTPPEHNRSLSRPPSSNPNLTRPIGQTHPHHNSPTTRPAPKSFRVTVRAQNNASMFFTMLPHTPMRKLIARFRADQQLNDDERFLFENVRLHDDHTAASLGMDEGEENLVEVYAIATGGGGGIQKPPDGAAVVMNVCCSSRY